MSLTPTDAVSQLKRDEGFRQFPYKDAVGVLTIGYGFNLESDGLTEEESAAVLAIRYRNRYAELLKALPWVSQLDPVRQAVLTNMAYNLGVAGLLEFKRTLAHVKAGEFESASQDMLDSKWANQVGPRAHRLSIQMQTGVWQ